MDKKIKVNLNSIEDIKKFANKVTRLYSDVNITKGRIIYDAKSIMAVFSLGTTDNIYVEIISDDKKEIEDFNYLMEEFRVE